MVFVDDLINIYVDFLPITTTTSPDDALALLISMYTIFELNFPKNNRTMRLLYSILHADKRFLPNTVRAFIREKQIDFFDGYGQSDSNGSAAEKDKSQCNTVQSQSSVAREKPKEVSSSSASTEPAADVRRTTAASPDDDSPLVPSIATDDQ